MLINRHSLELRTQTHANPHVLGPWIVARPGYAIFLENCSNVQVEVSVGGGEEYAGPFVREYASDTLVLLHPKARQVVVVNEIAKFLGFWLDVPAPDGVRIEVVTFNPPVNQDIARESVTGV